MILLLKKTVLVWIFTFFVFYSITGMVVDASSDPYAEFRQRVSAYNMNVPMNYEPYKMGAYSQTKYFHFIEDEHSTGSNLNYYTSIHQTFVQNTIDRSLFAFLYKVHMSPQQWGNFWKGREVRKFYIDSVVTLRTNEYHLLSYAPSAEPQVQSGSVGFGIDQDGKFSFSISVNYETSDLTVNPKTNVGQRKYQTEYRINKLSTYGKDDSSYSGGFIFEYNPDYSTCGSNYSCYSYKSYARVDIQHNIRYDDVNPGIMTNASGWTYSFFDDSYYRTFSPYNSY